MCFIKWVCFNFYSREKKYREVETKDAKCYNFDDVSKNYWQLFVTRETYNVYKKIEICWRKGESKQLFVEE